jgi:hypothetical protein
MSLMATKKDRKSMRSLLRELEKDEEVGGSVEYNPIREDGCLRKANGLETYCKKVGLEYFNENRSPLTSIREGNLEKYLSVYEHMVYSLLGEYMMRDVASGNGDAKSGQVSDFESKRVKSLESLGMNSLDCEYDFEESTNGTKNGRKKMEGGNSEGSGREKVRVRKKGMRSRYDIVFDWSEVGVSQLFKDSNLKESLLSFVEAHISYLLDFVKWDNPTLYEERKKEFDELNDKIDCIVWNSLNEKEFGKMGDFNYVGEVPPMEEARRREEILKRGRETRGKDKELDFLYENLL